MLIAKFFNTIKYTFEKYHCKVCGYESKSTIKMLYHLRSAHECKLNKSHWKFLVKYNLVIRLLKSACALVALPLLIVVKVICIPFYFLYEIL